MSVRLAENKEMFELMLENILRTAMLVLFFFFIATLIFNKKTLLRIALISFSIIIALIAGVISAVCLVWI